MAARVRSQQIQSRSTQRAWASVCNLVLGDAHPQPTVWPTAGAARAQGVCSLGPLSPLRSVAASLLCTNACARMEVETTAWVIGQGL
jgi:hypothetical protein